MYRLLRSIYGLKQSSYLWNRKIIRFFKTLDFKLLNVDPSILIAYRKMAILMISVYVNDFLFVSNNPRVLLWLKDAISKEYNVKDLGKVQTIIGWQVTRNYIGRTLKIAPSAFIQDLIKSDNMTDCNSVNIPMKASS